MWQDQRQEMKRIFGNQDSEGKYSNLNPNIFAPLLCCCTLFDVEIIHSPDIDTPLIYHNITARAPLNSWNLNTSPLTTTGTGRQQQPDWQIKLPTFVSHFP